ncbi:MAG: hypothetical protein R3293_11350 [Candidatus Promineifilaceae bacterium]|nr:hypothetical protein [Candidatus Promineifilaceae bacterium]
MGFLKKLFGGEKKSKEYIDTRGVYFYIRCDNCSTITRVRADKEYDLIRQGNGFAWHKTVVDNRCFRSMPTVVSLDNDYQVINAEISGGIYVSEEAYNSWLESRNNMAGVGDVTVRDDEEE